MMMIDRKDDGNGKGGRGTGEGRGIGGKTGMQMEEVG